MGSISMQSRSPTRDVCVAYCLAKLTPVCALCLLKFGAGEGL